MSGKRKMARATAVLALACLGTSVSGPSWAEPNVAFTITDPRIRESSGLARDAAHNVYWTANTAGEKGVVFALGRDGAARGTLSYAATPTDVEAVAMVGSRLYVGDIGDKQRTRDKITVYWFDAPAPNENRGGRYNAYDFSYPDGQHDAKAMMFDRQGRLYIITNEAAGAIYEAPRQPKFGVTNELTRVADAPAYVTDATTLADGSYVLRTYTTVEVVGPEIFNTTAKAALPYQARGESLTVGPDGNSLLIGSAGANSPVLSVPVPAGLVELPPAAASPPPAPTRSPSPTPTVAVESLQESTTSNRTGTLTALLAALLVSLGAGAIVYVKDGQRRLAIASEDEDTSVLGRRVKFSPGSPPTAATGAHPALAPTQRTPTGSQRYDPTATSTRRFDPISGRDNRPAGPAASGDARRYEGRQELSADPVEVIGTRDDDITVPRRRVEEEDLRTMSRRTD